VSGFKDMVARDIHRVFLNTGEFAETRSIKYDGVEYPDIPVVLEGPKNETRDRQADDHARGLHMATSILYCAQSDLGGKLPKQGKSLEITTREGGHFFQKYYIVSAIDSMGMLHIELEAVAQ